MGGQLVGVVVVGGVLHDNDDADVTPKGRPDFVALGLKTCDLAKNSLVWKGNKNSAANAHS